MGADLFPLGKTDSCGPHTDGLSSNGRTRPSGGCNRGSSPRGSAGGIVRTTTDSATLTSTDWTKSMSAAHRAEQGLEPRKKLTRNTVLLWAAAVLLFVGLPIAAVAAGGPGAPTCGQSGQCTP